MSLSTQQNENMESSGEIILSAWWANQNYNRIRNKLPDTDGD